MIMRCMVPEISRVRNKIYLSFWTVFCPFAPLTTPKKKFFEKLKKTPGDIIILHKYTKNYDHMLYCSWDMARDRCNCYFSFWAIFCPFTPLAAQKIKIFTKWKKTPGDIIILYMCTTNYDQMMFGSWDMVCDKWMDWQMDRQTDGWTNGWTDGKSDI